MLNFVFIIALAIFIIFYFLQIVLLTQIYIEPLLYYQKTSLWSAIQSFYLNKKNDLIYYIAKK